MPAPLVDLDDLKVWSDKTIEDDARGDAILVAASTLVRSFKGGAWVDLDEPPVSSVELEAARTVTKQVAYRTYFNPDGVNREQLEDYSVAVESWAALGCVLTEAEKSQLVAGRLGGLGSVRTTRGRVEMPSGRSCW